MSRSNKKKNQQNGESDREERIVEHFYGKFVRFLSQANYNPEQRKNTTQNTIIQSINSALC